MKWQIIACLHREWLLVLNSKSLHCPLHRIQHQLRPLDSESILKGEYEPRGGTKSGLERAAEIEPNVLFAKIICKYIAIGVQCIYTMIDSLKTTEPCSFAWQATKHLVLVVSLCTGTFQILSVVTLIQLILIF